MSLEIPGRPKYNSLPYTLAIIGQLLFLVGFAYHWEKFQRSLGMGETAVILIISLLSGLVPIGIIFWHKRQPTKGFTQLIHRLERLSCLLPLLLFLGLVSLLGMLFFQSLLTLFITLPIFFASILTYLAGVIIFLYTTLPNSKFRQLWQQVILMTAGLMVGLVTIEVGLTITAPEAAYVMLPPNARWEFHLDPETIPGVSNRTFFTTNAAGIRGDGYQGNGRYNILAIGGSTTETAFLDDSESWSYLLQSNLKQKNGRPSSLDTDTPVWVGNVGKSGHGLVEHIHALQFFVPQYEIDTVIMLVGINDFLPIIQHPDQYHEQYENPTNYAFYLHRSFYARPPVDPQMIRPFPENTAVWNLVDITLWNLLSRSPNKIVLEIPAGDAYIIRRANYLAAPLISELPDLEPALKQYQTNLLRIITLAESQHIRLVLATQPTVWHENLSPDMQRLLWFGFQGHLERPNGRYEILDLADGLDQFNQTLLDVCQEKAVDCVDLAAAMNGQEQYFYDDVHFNKAGSVKVAELFAEHFRRQQSSQDD